VLTLRIYIYYKKIYIAIVIEKYVYVPTKLIEKKEVF